MGDAPTALVGEAVGAAAVVALGAVGGTVGDGAEEGGELVTGDGAAAVVATMVGDADDGMVGVVTPPLEGAVAAPGLDGATAV